MRLTILLLGSLFFGGVPDRDNGSPELSASAGTGLARIAAVPGGHRLLTLGETDFELHIRARCDSGRQVEAVSLSVADTLQRFAPEIAGSTAEIDTLLRVRGSQIAPIAVEGFCDSDASRQPRQKFLGNVLSGQLSLRCRDEQTTTIHYTSVALDIELRCDRTGCADGEPCEDQPDSSSITRF